MALEIERKFLLKDDRWKQDAQGNPLQGVRFRQGYVPAEGATVRVRLEGDAGRLTLKARAEGIARLEYEYAIPAEDARDMLERLCARPQIDKVRYCLPLGAHVWEIDEFLGDNAGLVVAEIELAHEHEPFERPAWLGDEVTHDPRYLNVNLTRHPFKEWRA